MKTLIIKLQWILKLMTQYQSKLIKSLCVIGILLIVYLSSFNFLNMTEVSLNHNIIDGTVSCDTTRGMKLTAPWILVSVVDTRPVRVCIECSCRNLTCKLVSFNPKEYKLFVQKEGWSYFWFRNRLSFNSGNKQEYRGFENVVRGYSFDNVEYKFLTYE